MNMYVDKQELNKIAQAVLLSQQIHEESWDNGIIGVYKIKIHDATKKACDKLKLDPFWIDIITQWNHVGWNDIQEWAEGNLL